MPSLRAILLAGFILAVSAAPILFAQEPSAPSSIPTIRVTSSLVFLDVTVVDKKGRPVVKGLTEADFTINEDDKPQRIFSFEAPEVHVTGTQTEDEDPEGKAPVTIFVLDLLNSRFEDFAYIRQSMRKYLAAQRKELAAPAELMVLGNQSLEMLQGYTRDRADLLHALDHMRSAIPYKEMNNAFLAERSNQTFDALRQIALQNRGVPGRKNIIWIGWALFEPRLDFPTVPIDEAAFTSSVHETVNMLVDSRISLFLILPGIQAGAPPIAQYLSYGNAQFGNSTLRFSFAGLVNESGGKLFEGRNDVHAEIKEAQRFGADYYTLTYRPQNAAADGKLRKIRIALRDPSLRVITKTGYFAPDANAPVDPQQQRRMALIEASRSTVRFTALNVTVSDIVRHPDTGMGEFTLQLGAKNLHWQAYGEGKYTAKVMLAGVSLTRRGYILASHVIGTTLLANTPDTIQLAEELAPLRLTLQVPPKTHSVRFVVESEYDGRMGTVDMPRALVDAAPTLPAPEPQPAPADPRSPRTRGAL